MLLKQSLDDQIRAQGVQSEYSRQSVIGLVISMAIIIIPPTPYKRILSGKYGTEHRAVV